MIIKPPVDPLIDQYAQEGLRVFINSSDPLLTECDTCGFVKKQIVRVEKKTNKIKDMYCVHADKSIVLHNNVTVEW